MTFQFTVSPDFSPAHISGWYIFNTWLQKKLNVGIHLEMYDDFNKQRDAIRNGRVDLIYANPYDAAMLVREQDFKPLVQAEAEADEVIIAVNNEADIKQVEELSEGVTLAYTDDPDVRMIGMIMLEPADLSKENTQAIMAGSYVLVAKNLLNGKADVGFFLAEAFDDLSNIIKKQLRIVVRSRIGVINHALMIGPEFQYKRDELLDVLLTMANDEKGKLVLENLGFSSWQQVGQEEMEFMIDLMDALAT